MEVREQICNHHFISGGVFWWICVKCGHMEEKTPEESHLNEKGRSAGEPSFFEPTYQALEAYYGADAVSRLRGMLSDDNQGADTGSSRQVYR